MLGYLFSYFNGVAGDEELFTDKKMAVKEANEHWEHLTDKEKEEMEYCHVVGFECSEEEFEEMKENGYNEKYWVSDVWSMGGFRFITRDREAGNEIERFETLEEAKQAVVDYEATDKADKTYTEDFYEIYDSQLEKVVE